VVSGCFLLRLAVFRFLLFLVWRLMDSGFWPFQVSVVLFMVATGFWWLLQVSSFVCCLMVSGWFLVWRLAVSVF